MDHGFKLHPDGTLEITLPQGTKVGRVLVCEAGTRNESLYYPENDVPDINDGDMINCTDCIKHGGDWECDRTHCRKGTKQQATKAIDCISRRAAIVQLSHNKTGDDDCDVVIQDDIETIKALPSEEVSADIIHLQKEQAYMQGYEDGRKSRKGEVETLRKHTDMF